jgi:cobalt-precorrin-5B (C1)-methyltransferase
VEKKQLTDRKQLSGQKFADKEHYIYRNQQKLRCGYTTGSCAAGAAKAAATMLLGNCQTEAIRLMTPKGIELFLDIEDISRKPDQVRCAVRKDGGDDFDVTHGLLIYATVQRTEDCGEIRIDGGDGVGRVTKEGLDQPVGAVAINSVPRRMIREALNEVMTQFGYTGGLDIRIEVPGGDETARHTFNPRLGITGGISILGTSGIVEPMSEQALLDTIQVEIRMRKAEGRKALLITPGNYGLDFVRGKTELSSEIAVKCSNFIGETLDYSISSGFQKVLLIGHIGKLVKLGAGIMQTHSRTADGRMETLAACGIEAGVPYSVLTGLLKCNTTDDAVAFLKENGVLEPVMERLMARIEAALQNRTAGKMETAAIVFSNKYGLLGMTSQAEAMLQSSEFLAKIGQ